MTKFYRKIFKPFDEEIEHIQHGHVPVMYHPAANYEKLFAFTKGYLIGKGMIEEFNKALEEYFECREAPPSVHIIPKQNIEKEIK